MADFNLETAIKIISIFDGKYKELEPFLTIVELLYTTLATTGKTTLINFVTNVKLSATVRLSLCNASITDFNSLKSELLGKYKNNRTIPQIHSVLNSTYQNKSGVTVYKDKILSLIDELNQLQIQELGNQATLSEKKVITRMNETYALTIFKKGLNDQLKNTIFSARPTTFSDAVPLAQELENVELQATSNMLHIKGNWRGKRKNQKPNDNYKNGYNKNNKQQNNRSNSGNNNYSDNNNNRNNNNNGNNNHRNSNSNRSHRNRNNYNDGRNVHITTNQGNVIGFGEDTPNLPEINM
ncbi:unnamed protein product [Hermetia illucens]|uniref:Uncharacterized protein n=1 Tax=Hermetia illucens TaxID=343691 RepID=A0A7R8UKM8_HERIL|nr:unnamed protein product [Hermetia illucens]